MRALAGADRVRQFMRELGRRSGAPASIYFTGGATAVLYGWRDTTVDVDLRIEPDSDEILHAIANLKERLNMNVELASPEDSVPERHGALSFHHFELYAQALSKAERHHVQDIADVRAMLARGLIEPGAMIKYYTRVEPHLHRYPSIDAHALRDAVNALFASGAR